MFRFAVEDEDRGYARVEVDSPVVVPFSGIRFWPKGWVKEGIGDMRWKIIHRDEIGSSQRQFGKQQKAYTDPKGRKSDWAVHIFREYQKGIRCLGGSGKMRDWENEWDSCEEGSSGCLWFLELELQVNWVGR